MKAVPGIAPFLEALGEARIPRILATSATLANVDLVLERLALANQFEAAGAFCLGLSTSQSTEALYDAGADWVAPHFLALPEPLRARLSLPRPGE